MGSCLYVKSFLLFILNRIIEQKGTERWSMQPDKTYRKFYEQYDITWLKIIDWKPILTSRGNVASTG